ncbi:trichohyalin-like [Uranotaenia lowii]|uniref:trichohyalin-like n=1 Tax=Uranotaenia lowii TaxID=190385 RepID=UPI00247AF3B7|nr:trichohyalin-like [Uranotaenia lowii]
MIKELYQTVEPQQPSFAPTAASSSRLHCRSGAFRGPKAAMLTASKWNQLLSTASDGSKTRPQTAVGPGGKSLAQKEAEFKQYLKKESQEMTRKWDNTVQNIRQKKEAERLKRQQNRVEEDQKHYLELKAADEIKRNELIRKAEEMIQKEKEGPRVLESAAKFCEVLKAREHQRHFRSEQQAVQESRRRQSDQQDIAQANRWLKLYAERQIEDRKRFDNYKKELKVKIELDREELKKQRNHLIEQERRQHQALEEDTKRQVEKEKNMLERDKEIRRQHALEAMRMAQEREERLKREACIEETLNNIYNDGQKAIADKLKQIHINKHKFRDNSHMLKAEIEKNKCLMDETEKNRQDAIRSKEIEADKRERERIEAERKMKAARIQAHIQEIEWKKLQETEQAILDRKEMADRIKNVEVTYDFDSRKVTNHTKKAHVQRKLLLDQMDERIDREKQEADTRAELEYMRNSAEKENRHFLQYADELVNEAQSKGRPVLPLLKTVNNYKREHYFDFKEKNFVPRHLVSRVPINNNGVQQTQCEPYIPDPAIIEMTLAMPPIRMRYNPEQLKNMNPYKQNHQN